MRNEGKTRRRACYMNGRRVTCFHSVNSSFSHCLLSHSCVLRLPHCEVGSDGSTEQRHLLFNAPTSKRTQTRDFTNKKTNPYILNLEHINILQSKSFSHRLNFSAFYYDSGDEPSQTLFFLKQFAFVFTPFTLLPLNNNPLGVNVPVR